MRLLDAIPNTQPSLDTLITSSQPSRLQATSEPVVASMVQPPRSQVSEEAAVANISPPTESQASDELPSGSQAHIDNLSFRKKRCRATIDFSNSKHTAPQMITRSKLASVNSTIANPVLNSTKIVDDSVVTNTTNNSTFYRRRPAIVEVMRKRNRILSSDEEDGISLPPRKSKK